MSQLEVDKIIPQSGTTLTIGDSGDTITFADGAILGIDTDTLYIDSTNNRVGIGTSSPLKDLDVQGTTPVLRVRDTTPVAGLEISQDSSGNGSILLKSAGELNIGATNNNVNSIITFDTKTSEAMRIDSSGNVGIGTSSPSGKLEVTGTNGAVEINSLGTQIAYNYDGFNYLTASGASATLQIQASGASGKLTFVTNASERMRIDSSGNVGIGTSSPSATLHVNGNIFTGLGSASSPALQVGDANTGIFDGGTNVLAFTANGSEAMRIDGSGRLLVGTTSTSINTSNFGFVFDTSTDVFKTSRNVNGGGTSAEHFGNAGQIRFMGDGDAENTNNSYGALSDRTLKENETSANSQWNDIKALQIKNYNLIEYPDRPQIGVIAQDLEEAGMNGLVKTDDEGLKSVKYSVLYMKAVKALQEAMLKIEDLEARVNTLEGN